jgi:hypothetical protein
MAESQVLKRLDSPAYCIRVLDNGLVAIAGGGGKAKTGVGNLIELGLVDYHFDSKTEASSDGQATFKSIHSFEPEDAIMKFVSFSLDRNHRQSTAVFSQPPTGTNHDNQSLRKNSLQNGKVQNLSTSSSTSGYSQDSFDSTKCDMYLAAAVNDNIEIYKLSPKLNKTTTSTETNGLNNGYVKLEQANNFLKNRKGSIKSQRKSSSSSHNYDHQNHSQYQTTNTNLEASVELKLVCSVNIKNDYTNPNDFLSEPDPFEETPDQDESSQPAHHTTTTTTGRTRKRTVSLRIDEESICSLAVCKSFNKVHLCAGTSKGSIIIWSSLIENNNNLIKNDKIKFEKVHEFKEAHGKHEVDDLQVNNGNYLLSIGRDNKCFIWSLNSFTKVTEIVYVPALNNDSNLRMKHARFATCSNCLYTTFIPRIRGGGRDMSSYITRWSISDQNKADTFKYKLEGKHRIRNTILTTIQCSKDGLFVCVGDYEGRIDLFDLNFNKVINFKKQHSSVITDLIFYHDFVDSSSQQDQNKLILTISIDRTLQCYKYINESVGGTLSSHRRKGVFFSLIDQLDICSINTFKLFCIFFLFILFFCYFFCTFVE